MSKIMRQLVEEARKARGVDKPVEVALDVGDPYATLAPDALDPYPGATPVPGKPGVYQYTYTLHGGVDNGKKLFIRGKPAVITAPNGALYRRLSRFTYIASAS